MGLDLPLRSRQFIFFRDPYDNRSSIMPTTSSHCQCATRVQQQWNQAWDELQSSTYSILRGQEAPKEHAMAQYHLALPRELHRSRLINLARGPDPHDLRCEAGKRSTALVATDAGGIYQHLLSRMEGLSDMNYESASRFHLALYSNWYDDQRGGSSAKHRREWYIIDTVRYAVSSYRSAQNGEFDVRLEQIASHAIHELVRGSGMGFDQSKAIADVHEALMLRKWDDEILVSILTVLELHAAQLQDEWITHFTPPSTVQHYSQARFCDTDAEKKEGTMSSEHE